MKGKHSARSLRGIQSKLRGKKVQAEGGWRVQRSC